MDLEDEIAKKKYKRVKRIPPSANPLFEMWLTQWRDEAAAKGWKIQYIYQKALSSLKKYPLTLNSGREAKILQYFGDKVCTMLDDKLKKYQEEHGIQSSGQKDSQAECNSNGENSSPVKHSPKKQSSKSNPTSREYVPLVGSGGHAILLALYKNEMQNGPSSFMRKPQLMDAAQPYCQKSFRIADAGKFQTAWSSMGNLVRKGLVIKESSPAKYFLTDKGSELAKKLSDVMSKQADGVSCASQSSTILSSDSNQQKYGQNILSSGDYFTSSQSSISSQVSLKENATSVTAEGFKYCYVTENGEEVRERSKALVSIVNDTVGFLIKCRRDVLFSSGKFFKLDTSRPSSEFVYAYLHNCHTDEFSPMEETSLPQRLLDILPGQSDNLLTGTGSGSSCNDFQHQKKIVLSPGNFEIILCVDICETVTGTMNMRKLSVQSDLRKNGVAFDVRKLNVGDFAWIAREKVAVIPGQLRLPQAKELVLDFIVERKRMDDLASSIKDGRFHEQKHRLKTCGLRKPIYLVEAMGSSAHYSLPESSLLQAIANTQVINGFTIKRTDNLDSTIRYLTVMTRYLQSFYSNKTLIGCSYFDLSAENDMANEICYLMTFEEFNCVSVKNKELTVGELFIKQLIQIRGLSVDKAVAITKIYPTPASLFVAYENCATDKDKENLLTNIKFGIGLRNIGPKLSKTVKQLYCNKLS